MHSFHILLSSSCIALLVATLARVYAQCTSDQCVLDSSDSFFQKRSLVFRFRTGGAQSTCFLINPSHQPKLAGFFRHSFFLVPSHAIAVGNPHFIVLVDSSTQNQYVVEPIIIDCAPRDDVCLIAVQHEYIDTKSRLGVSLVPINSSKLIPGAEIFSWSFPSFFDGTKPLYSAGYIADTYGPLGAPTLIMTNLQMHPGSSGAPVFDSSGDFVGMFIRASFRRPDNFISDLNQFSELATSANSEVLRLLSRILYNLDSVFEITMGHVLPSRNISLFIRGIPAKAFEKLTP